MGLGRLRPSCQQIVSYVLDGASARPAGHRPTRPGRAPRSIQSAAKGNSHPTALGTDMEASWRRFNLNCSRVSPVSAWRKLENDFLIQSNVWTGSSPYSSAKKSAGAENVQGPVAVDCSSLLEEDQFHDLADDVLHHLQDKIEVYGEDLNVEGFDLDYSSGVLTLRLGDLGTYVINKQTPNRQIWLSSPVSGPGRFDWSESKSSWIYRRNNIELVPLLERELSKLLGATIRLSED